MRLTLGFFLVINSPLVLGHEGRNCADALGKLTIPHIHHFNSGRDLAQIEELRAAAQHIYLEVAPKLGFTVPNMVIKSLSESDMAALTASTGHPAPHWYDGLQVMGSAKRAGSILEFVETGRDSHVQYVRDTNSIPETLIVYSHVVGHYDFAETSYLFRVRNGDRIRDSAELADLMSRLYNEYDFEEVSKFYQWLLSTRYLQDMHRGSFEDPEHFKQPRIERRVRIEPSADRFSFSGTEARVLKPQHPAAPTPSTLQSWVQNLPPEGADFEKEMIEIFERIHRVVPAIMHTKIMNEGWATFAEYLILSHGRWKSRTMMLTFAEINSWISVPNFENPYWLGVQAFLRLRERFIERPEIKNLSVEEQDRAFVEYAKTNYISKHTDYSFLTEALDRTWVERLNLHLWRETTRSDAEKFDESKNITVTRDSERILRWVVNRHANFEWKIPLIEMLNFNHNEEGSLLLRHKAVH